MTTPDLPITSARRLLGIPRLAAVGLFSAILNLLGLTGSIYMLQVYDRVLPSQSVPTLVGLTIGMAGLYAAWGLLDFIRQRLLVRMANRLDQTLRGPLFACHLALPLRAGAANFAAQPLRDLDQVRTFLAGPGPAVFFDLPWIPVFLALIFMLHFDLGMLALLGAAVSVALTVAAEIFSRRTARRLNGTAVARQNFNNSGRRNAEIVRALGLGGRLEQAAKAQNLAFLRDQSRLLDLLGGTASFSRTLRMMLQSLMLGLGAFLVIRGEASAGIIIASSIMLGRALAPVDTAIAQWKSFVAARQSFGQIRALLANFEDRARLVALPAPSESLSVEALAVGAPGGARALISNVSFRLEAGTGLAVIGPSGSGKSTLIRALVGAWTPLHGTIRLDGAALDQWHPDQLGRHLGYLPQDIELFDGTVAENIARLDPAPEPGAILAAAQAAGVHEMILRLPDGFQTQVGEGGTALSAGQRQLVGLARALYGNPFLVVLDEPNSNLDPQGEATLAAAIGGIRARGGIVITVAHRLSALAQLDLVLVMRAGTMQAFGPRDEVLGPMIRPGPQPMIPQPGGAAPAPFVRQLQSDRG